MHDLLKNSIWILILCLSIGLKAQDQEYDFSINVLEGKQTKVVMMDDVSKAICLNCKSKFYDYQVEENNTLVFTGLEWEVKNCLVQVVLKNNDEYKIQMNFTKKGNAKLYYDVRSRKALKALQEEQQNETYAAYEAPDDQNQSEEKTLSGDGEYAGEPEQKISGETISDDKEIADHIKNIMSSMDGTNKDLITQVSNLISNFQTYCNFLTEPSRKSEYETIKKQLRELFFEPDNAIIQVVTGGQVKLRTLEEYMNKVISLQQAYRKFRYKDKNVQIIGKLRQKDDGVYTAVAVFTQEFSAVVKNKEGVERLLRTNTTKYAEIVVKLNRKLVNGELKYSWKAYLQNITANKSE
jgi:hypothetical protein